MERDYQEPYDLSDWISRNMGKSFIDVYAESQKEYAILERIESKKKNTDRDYHKFRNYKSSIHGFLFFLNSGGNPAGSSLLPFIPLIKNLIENGYLKSSALDVFKDLKFDL